MATGILWVVCVVMAVIVQRTEGACTFPQSDGTWKSSSWGDMVFSSSNQVTVSGLPVGNVDFDCEIKDGDTYVLKSATTYNVLGNVVYVTACMHFEQVSSYSFSYYHYTDDVTYNTGDEPILLVSTSTSVTVASTCDLTNHATGTNHMMVLSGSELDAAIQCPDPMLATFDNYTVEELVFSFCNGVGYISVCDNVKNVSVNYGVCSTDILYSSEGNLQCVHSTQSGSEYFVNLYNFDATVDDSSTYRFACMVVSYGSESGTVVATYYPQACDSAQTATSVSSPGGSLSLSSNHTCIPTTTAAASSSSNTGVIVAVIMLLLLIIIIAILAFYCFYIKKRWQAFKRMITCANKKGQVDPAKETTTAKEDVEQPREPAAEPKEPAAEAKPEAKPEPQPEPEPEPKETEPPKEPEPEPEPKPEPKPEPVPEAEPQPAAPASEEPVTAAEASKKTEEPASVTTDDHEVLAITNAAEASLLEGDGGDGASVPRRLPPLETHVDMPNTPSPPAQE